MLHEHSEKSKYEWVLALLKREKYSGERGRFGTARTDLLRYRQGPVGGAASGPQPAQHNPVPWRKRDGLERLVGSFRSDEMMAGSDRVPTLHVQGRAPSGHWKVGILRRAPLFRDLV